MTKKPSKPGTVRAYESLPEYIDRVHDGVQAEFARSEGVKPQQVTQWIERGFIVVDGALYSQRRPLVTATPPKESARLDLHPSKRR